MYSVLAIGLFISLVGSPLVLALCKRLRFEPWAVTPRLALWLIAAVVVSLAFLGTNNWWVRLGFMWPSFIDLIWAVVTGVVLVQIFGFYARFKQQHGLQSATEAARYQALVGLSLGSRCLTVLTAAVVEEVLYRAYAIGIGEVVLGSVWVAAAVSVLAFTAAHFRWGLSHLVPVFISAVAFAVLFATTRNIWLCILAHVIVDGVAFLVVPATIKRQAQASGRTR